jgi:hypothetical protein
MLVWIDIRGESELPQTCLGVSLGRSIEYLLIDQVLHLHKCFLTLGYFCDYHDQLSPVPMAESSDYYTNSKKLDHRLHQSVYAQILPICFY